MSAFTKKNVLESFNENSAETRYSGNKIKKKPEHRLSKFEQSVIVNLS